MSATLAPKVLSPDNPVTDSSVADTLHKLGLKLPDEQVGDYTSFLKGIWEVWHKVDGMDDYVPVVDEKRFPRENVHRPTGDDNPANAWAWKVTITDQEKRGGLLAGKTVCVKDNVTVKGVPCLLGTDFIKDWIPDTDATVVTRILEAGGTILGKAVCENMSLWGMSDSSATGTMHNIYAEGYSAGGSSSGTGVLVARGDVDLGIGGDQAGSIRLPASKNGIVGMKPTFGLVPYTGIASLEPTIDHTGPMTRTVLDNALLLQAIAGADGIDDRQMAGCPMPGDVLDYPSLATQGVKGMRIGILVESLDCPLHDARVSELVVKAAKGFKELGAVVETVSVPMHRVAPDLWAVVGRFSAASAMSGRAAGRRQLFLNDLTNKMLPMTQERLPDLFVANANTLVNGLWGWEHMPPTLFGKATNLVRKLRDDYYKALDKFDLLVMPTIPFLPQRLASADASLAEKMTKGVGMTMNTAPFNLVGVKRNALTPFRLACQRSRSLSVAFHQTTSTKPCSQLACNSSASGTTSPHCTGQHTHGSKQMTGRKAYRLVEASTLPTPCNHQTAPT